MTIQQGVGLAAACMATLVTFLIGADSSGQHVPDGIMLGLGAVSAVLGAANAFLGGTGNMARSLLGRYPDNAPLSMVARAND